MVKFAKRADPLRARALRVTKPRCARKDSRTLPSWCYRVHGISFREDRDVNAHDFDEDLSELEEDKEQERDDVKQFKEEKQDCDCGGEDLECDCQFEDDSDLDEDDESNRSYDGSDRSYDGSDADYYYELKEEREERKLEKLRERKRKEREREMERTKEEEVRAAYRSLNKSEEERKIVPAGSLARQSFKLFCSDHVDHFYCDEYPTKRVDFYHFDDTEYPHLDNGRPGSGTDMLYGDVYLNSNANCNFGPFCPPERASWNTFKVKSDDGKYELSFQFIGNGYLKLRVSREMVFMNPYSANPPAPPPAAPEVFEFVGIWRDLEKERAERQERMAKVNSPSPRESWFKMNHPMGSYYF